MVRDRDNERRTVYFHLNRPLLIQTRNQIQEDNINDQLINHFETRLHDFETQGTG